MDSLRGYVGKVSQLVSSVIEEADNAFSVKPDSPETQVAGDAPLEVDKNDANPNDVSNIVTPTSEAKSTGKGFFDWLPGLQSSAEHYLNSLASLGVPPVVDNPVEDTTPKVVTEEPVDDFKPKSETTAESSNTEDGTSQTAPSNWLNTVSSRGEEVWKHIKQDFNEVLATASKERKEMTDAIYQHISTATAETSNKINLSNFHILSESKPEEGDTSENAPDIAEFPTLSDLRDDVKKLVNDFVSTLFGSDTPHAVSGNDRREARLQIIRADPATYEVEPPPPPEHLKLHCYADWRAAYFDETICQPLPGIPLFPYGSEELANAQKLQKVKEELQLIEPQHLSPEELLDAHPFMRTYLTQLVGDFPGTLTDGDFWSRYYYRVWLMDVTEARRQLLTARLTGKEAADDGGNPMASPGSDWLDDSDDEQVTASTTNQPATTTSVTVVSTDEQETSSSPSEKVQDKKPPKAKSSTGAKQRRPARKVSERSEKRQPAVDAQPTPAPDVAVVSAEDSTCRPVQQTCESDGSSSIVVLGNTEDDEAVPTVNQGTTYQQYTTEVLVHSSAEPSDEWTDVIEDDPNGPEISCFASEKPAESNVDREKSEGDDWEDWS